MGTISWTSYWMTSYKSCDNSIFADFYFTNFSTNETKWNFKNLFNGFEVGNKWGKNLVPVLINQLSYSFVHFINYTLIHTSLIRDRSLPGKISRCVWNVFEEILRGLKKLKEFKGSEIFQIRSSLLRSLKRIFRQFKGCKKIVLKKRSAKKEFKKCSKWLERDMTDPYKHFLDSLRNRWEFIDFFQHLCTLYILLYHVSWKP